MVSVLSSSCGSCLPCYTWLTAWCTAAALCCLCMHYIRGPACRDSKSMLLAKGRQASVQGAEALHSGGGGSSSGGGSGGGGGKRVLCELPRQPRTSHGVPHLHFKGAPSEVRWSQAWATGKAAGFRAQAGCWCNARVVKGTGPRLRVNAGSLQHSGRRAGPSVAVAAQLP